MAESTPYGYTPSQTIGPFFHFGLLEEDRSHLVPEDDPRAIRLVGTVYDGAGEVVPDAMVEVFQPGPEGRYLRPETSNLGEFTGFGRCGTDASGSYSFLTVKPGAPSPSEAPHLDVSLFARGLLKRLITRVYFPDEGEANDLDPVLGAIEDEGVRRTLVARRDGDALRFDIHLQGEGETAFFAFAEG